MGEFTLGELPQIRSEELMRIASSVLLSFVLISMTASSASAQLGRVIGRKVSAAVERKAEQKIDQKIEEAAENLVNKSFDAIFVESEPSSTSTSGSSRSGSSRIFAALPNAPTESHYDFTTVFTYEIENIPKGKTKGDEKALMMMHFSESGQYAGTRILAEDQKKSEGELFAIFDVKNESMVMLFSSEDGKFSMAYGWKEAQKFAERAADDAPRDAPAPARPASRASSSGEAPAATFTSLGQRRIAGFTADGYRSESTTGVAEVWVSTDPAISHGRMMGVNGSMKQVRSAMPTSHPAGMLLETIITDKETGDKSRMTVTRIDRNAKVRVDMEEYPRLGKKAS